VKSHPWAESVENAGKDFPAYLIGSSVEEKSRLGNSSAKHFSSKRKGPGMLVKKKYQNS